jgi:ABC-type amino acid transport substrate-binding protein
VKSALLTLIKNGTYQRIFAAWGLQSIEITSAQVKVNGATG